MATSFQTKYLVARIKLKIIQQPIPRAVELKANKETPSFATSRRPVTITLRGSALAKGWRRSGMELMGKKTPDNISCGKVINPTMGLMAS